MNLTDKRRAVVAQLNSRQAQDQLSWHSLPAPGGQDPNIFHITPKGATAKTMALTTAEAHIWLGGFAAGLAAADRPGLSWLDLTTSDGLGWFRAAFPDGPVDIRQDANDRQFYLKDPENRVSGPFGSADEAKTKAQEVWGV